jgi:hypothetical protein
MVVSVTQSIAKQFVEQQHMEMMTLFFNEE